MPHNLLIIAPSISAEPVADALRHELNAIVEVAPHRRAGLAALRRAEFSLVLLDEPFADLDVRGTNLLYQNAGSAPLLELNFSISKPPRIVRQVRAALAHRAYDVEKARTAAAAALQSELNSSLTALLLESQLALRSATPADAPRLQHLVDLAGNLRNRLRV